MKYVSEQIERELKEVERLAKGLDGKCMHPWATYKPELLKNEFYKDIHHPLQCDTCHAVFACDHSDLEYDDNNTAFCMNCGTEDLPQNDYEPNYDKYDWMYS